jgi:Zn-dependent M28 family amino/carboxypeptidase
VEDKIKTSVFSSILIIAFIINIINIGKANAQDLLPEGLSERLKKHVVEISGNIGERNYWFYKNLQKTANYIINELKNYGYQVELHTYTLDNKEFSNIIAVKKGKTHPNEIIIIGAHYDSVMGSPGADDNASGVAGLLELACLFSQKDPAKTLKFIAFTNEEPPFFQTPQMGSRVYAKSAKQNKEKIVAMICLEMLGYYNKKPNSQNHPLFLGLLYPHTADFIAFVSNFGSTSLLNKFKKYFKQHSNFPVETLAAPNIISGVDWSDHSSFWKYGYKAIMITDTSFYRYPYYHSQSDTYEKLDYESMSVVVSGLYLTLRELSA